MSTRTEHFPLFNSLRAIAALSVFAFHAVYQISVAKPGTQLWYPLGVHLDVGIAIFFVLSGFLLYRPFLAATLEGRRVDVRAYAWRRLMRIAPAYWVALAVLTVWFDFREVKSLEGVLRFGLFAQIYDSDTALRGVGQAWTLDIEMAFYAFLPIFALLIARARTLSRALAAVALLIAASVAYNAFALTQTDAAAPGSAVWLLSFPGHLDHLGAGMLLAVLALGAAPRRLERFVERRPTLIWGLAAFTFLVIGAATDRGTRSAPPITDPQHLVKHELYALFAVLLVLPAVFGDRSRIGLPRRLLGWRPLAALGTISYSFYLWHYAVVAQQARWWDRAPEGLLEWTGWTLGALAGATLLAWLSYVLVERPAMALGRRLPARRVSAETEAAQARAAP